MDIKPFKAYRFNKEAVGNPGDCIAPPYDVIDSSMQNELYNRSPYNIVRAIKGKSDAGDNSDNNVYLKDPTSNTDIRPVGNKENNKINLFN